MYAEREQGNVQALPSSTLGAWKTVKSESPGESLNFFYPTRIPILQ